MAWSFARGVVAARLPQPRKALFPQFRPEYVERAGDGVFVVRATVGSADEYGNPVSYRFSVIANYRGNDIFEATEIELLRE
jgi:ketosteroid isomerase-like protein